MSGKAERRNHFCHFRPFCTFQPLIDQKSIREHIGCIVHEMSELVPLEALAGGAIGLDEAIVDGFDLLL